MSSPTSRPNASSQNSTNALQSNGAGPNPQANGHPPSSSSSGSSIPPEVIGLATRLFEGARRGEVPLFEQVLGHNSSVKDLRNDKGDTLIMLAAYHGHVPLVRLLLSYGADPNILNDRQQSPLAGAIFKGEKEVVEALSDAGADWGVGEPSAREAVRIFRQEDVWGHRMGAGSNGGGEGRGDTGEGR